MSITDSGDFSPEQREEYRRLETDPVYFYKKFFATPEEPDFYPYQKQVAYDVVNPLYDEYAILKGRQIGMSWEMGAIECWYAMMNPQKIVLTVSFHLEQSQIILDYAKTFMARLKNKGLFEFFVEGASARNLRFTNGSKILAFGTTIPDAYNVRGQFAHLLVVDEAHIIYDRMFPSITPTTSNTKGKTIYLSTAGSVGSHFYRRWEEGNKCESLRGQISKGYDVGLTFDQIPKIKAYTIPSFECPRLTTEKLESEKRSLGELKFNREFLCIWAGTSDQVFPKIPTYTLRKLPTLSVKPCYGGLDVGKVNDPTVLTIIEEHHASLPIYLNGVLSEVMVPFRIAYIKSWERETQGAIANDIIMNIHPRFKTRLYEIDATGGWATDILKRLVDGGLPCRGITVGSKSKNDMMLGSPTIKGLSDAFAEDLLWINNELNDIMSVELIFELNAYIGKLSANGLYIFDSVIDRDHGVDCYDDQTEVLTEDGWKLFKNTSYNDKIATLNRDEYLEYQHPTNLISYHYEGKMFTIKNSTQLDLCVTPNHKMLIAKHGGENRWHPFKLAKAEDIFNNKVKYKKDAKWAGNDTDYFILPKYKNKMGFCYYVKEEVKIPIELWLEFFGYYISEGSSSGRHVSITQTKEKEKQTIKECLNKLPFKWRENESGFEADSVQFSTYLKQFGKSYERYIPKWIKELNSELLEVFLRAYYLGDGWKGTWKASSSSKKLIDDLQEIFLKTGKSANVSIKNKKGDLGGKIEGRQIAFKHNHYYISGITKQNTPRINHNIWGATNEWIDYNGEVYCCTVPNHIIYVRRNGKPCWSGNSLAHAWSAVQAGSFAPLVIIKKHRGP